MKLVLRVSSSNQYCDGGCELAVVDLTQQLASVALRRVHVLGEHKKSDESVYETYYWAYHAEYFSPDFANAARKSNGAMRAVAEIVEALEFEKKEVVTVPDNFEVAEAHIAAVECEQMVVRELCYRQHNSRYVAESVMWHSGRQAALEKSRLVRNAT